MKTVVVAGGTGLIGGALTAALIHRGYRVVVLSRRKQASSSVQLEYRHWNPEQNIIDGAAFANADALINLAGANIAEKRWTKKRKQEIVNSRILSGKLLSEVLLTQPNRVEVVINASAIGWYGPDQSGKFFEETEPPASDFFGETCRLWEASIAPVAAQKRLVIFRTGIVLSTNGSAYAEFRKPLRFGLAPLFGNGRQMISWIHIDDLVRLYLFALDHQTMQGIYNAVAPRPVSQKTLMETMVRVRQQKAVFIRLPAFLLKLMLGELSSELLKTVSVSANKVLQSGFQFHYADLLTAIRQLEHR